MEKQTSSGVGILTVITLILGMLKTLGLIEITWLQVFIPMIISGVAFTFILIAFIVYLIVGDRKKK